MGSDLYEQVFYSLDLIEKDYFGLQFTDANNVQHWLDATKIVKKQVKSEYHRQTTDIGVYNTVCSHVPPSISVLAAEQLAADTVFFIPSRGLVLIVRLLYYFSADRSVGRVYLISRSSGSGPVTQLAHRFSSFAP